MGELMNYKSTLEEMVFIGRLTNPVILYHASNMATKTRKLLKHHFKNLASLFRHLKKNNSLLTFKKPEVAQNSV